MQRADRAWLTLAGGLLLVSSSLALAHRGVLVWAFTTLYGALLGGEFGGLEERRLLERGVAQFEAGRRVEAEQAFDASLAIDPHSEARTYLAELALERGELGRAGALLESILVEDPPSASAWMVWVELARRQAQPHSQIAQRLGEGIAALDRAIDQRKAVPSANPEPRYRRKREQVLKRLQEDRSQLIELQHSLVIELR